MMRTLLAVCVLAALVGCNQPQSTVPPRETSLIISLSDSGARTILPTPPAGSTYEIVITPSSGNPVTVTQADLTTPIPGLYSGLTTVTVTLKDSNGQTLAQSDATSVVIDTSQPTPLSVLLRPAAGGSGNLDLKVSWPLGRLSSVHGSLYTSPAPGSPVSTVMFMTPASPFTVSTSQSFTAVAPGTNPPSLASGAYLVKIDPSGGTDKAGAPHSSPFPTITRIVQVWPGVTTKATIALTDADLTAVPASPSGLSVSQQGNVITLTWQDNSSNEDGFNVYSPNLFSILMTPGAGTNLARFTGTPITSWSFQVTAFNTIGESTPSPMLNYTYQVVEMFPVPSLSSIPVGWTFIPSVTWTEPAHTVPSLVGFDLGRTEVTYVHWLEVYNYALGHAPAYSFANAGSEAVTGVTPPTAPATGSTLPAVGMSWRDAMVWCNALSEMQGLIPFYYVDGGHTTPLRSSVDSLAVNATAGSIDTPFIKLDATGYRLPTEAEWEAAARYQGSSGWQDGDQASAATAKGETAAKVVGWFGGAGGAATVMPAGQKPANFLGFQDMGGNVNEMVQDWYDVYAIASPFTDADTQGPSAGSYRVFRGGSVGDNISTTGGAPHPEASGVSNRGADSPWLTSTWRGFRVARGPLVP